MTKYKGCSLASDEEIIQFFNKGVKKNRLCNIFPNSQYSYYKVEVKRICKLL